MDGGIRIVVLGNDGGAVRLGIDAPTSVGIVREEVAQRIAEENVRAGAQPEDRAFVESLGAKRKVAADDEGEADREG